MLKKDNHSHFLHSLKKKELNQKLRLHTYNTHQYTFDEFETVVHKNNENIFPKRFNCNADN